MDKYKGYDVRTQSERIQLDILFALDRILEKLESKYNDEQVVSDKEVEVINEIKQKKKARKSGGDK